MIKSFDEFQSFGKDGFEAYTASATAVTKGLQSIAAETADYSRKSFETGAAAAEKLLAAKSVDKAVEVQQNYAKEAYEAYVGQVTKFGELYADVAKDAFKPFEAQIAKFSGKAVSK